MTVAPRLPMPPFLLRLRTRLLYRTAAAAGYLPRYYTAMRDDVMKAPCRAFERLLLRLAPCGR